MIYIEGGILNTIDRTFCGYVTIRDGNSDDDSAKLFDLFAEIMRKEALKNNVVLDVKTPDEREQAMSKFKIGDVVILKSGSPRMTVCQANVDSYRLVWFTQIQDFKVGEFPEETLMLEPVNLGRVG
jgi:uncharacterized protein YodC (DUF2158 family)